MGAFADQATVASTEIELFRVWLRFIRLNQRLYGSMAVRLKAIGLSVPQFDLISTLTERQGMSQQELSERLYVTKGNVSGLVDRLVAGGLVERRALAKDRRSHALYLTAKGSALANAGIAIQRAYVTETLGQLDRRDIADLERVLLAWRDVLRAGRLDAPGPA
jgi:MarR family transcriptional regulator, organic hydroperoxide resistance regulator